MAKKYKSKLQKVMNQECELVYETTYDDCKEWFQILNKELFNNKLPTVEQFDIRWRRGAWGYYVYDKGDSNYYAIEMNKRYKSKKFFIEVLTHEMVHHWQNVTGAPLGHGPSFEEWNMKLKKKGLQIKDE